MAFLFKEGKKIQGPQQTWSCLYLNEHEHRLGRREGTNKIQTSGKQPPVHCQGPLDSHFRVGPHQEETLIDDLDCGLCM